MSESPVHCPVLRPDWLAPAGDLPAKRKMTKKQRKMTAMPKTEMRTGRQKIATTTAKQKTGRTGTLMTAKRKTERARWQLLPGFRRYHQSYSQLQATIGIAHSYSRGLWSD